jgi:hypothetical protein
LENSEHLRSLLQPGNCVPCALEHLTGNIAHFAEKGNADGLTNLNAHSEGYRTYRSCLSMLADVPNFNKRFLCPELELPAECTSNFLLHVESEQGPHCVAVIPDGEQLVVWDGAVRFVLSRTRFAKCAMDKGTLVYFLLVLEDLSALHKAGCMLDLCAGASSQKSLGSRSQSEGSSSTSKPTRFRLRKKTSVS